MLFCVGDWSSCDRTYVSIALVYNNRYYHEYRNDKLMYIFIYIWYTFYQLRYKCCGPDVFLLLLHSLLATDLLVRAILSMLVKLQYFLLETILISSTEKQSSSSMSFSSFNKLAWLKIHQKSSCLVLFWSLKTDSGSSGSGLARNYALYFSLLTHSFVPEIGYIEAPHKVFDCFCHNALLYIF